MNKRNFWKFGLMALAVVAVLILSMEMAEARPGGGHSSSHSSGHSRGGSGGGSGGSVTIIFELLRLIWCSGPIGKIVLIAIVLAVIYFVFIKEKKADYRFAPSQPSRDLSREDQLLTNVIKASDKAFSPVIFKDFVGLLFMRYMTLRGIGNNFNEIRPFFSDATLTDEDIKDTSRYSEVAINSIIINNAYQNDDYVYVGVSIRADYTRTTAQGDSKRQQSNIVMLLRRDKNAQTVEPKDSTRICCPHCGANENFTDAGTCTHCGQAIVPGKSTWQVVEMSGENNVVSINSTFLNYSDSDDETMQVHIQVSENCSAAMDAMARKSGMENQEAFGLQFQNNVARPAILAIYKAWSDNNLKACRHLLSDRQYESMKIWTDYLAKNGVYNRMENISIDRIRIVDAQTDQFYDSIMCEIEICCADYMTDQNGKKLAGHTNATPFRELFTFVRGAQADSSKEFSIGTCPSCGAPADAMGESAVCEYCGTKISTGKFSWVLAGIEQVC